MVDLGSAEVVEGAMTLGGGVVGRGEVGRGEVGGTVVMIGGVVAGWAKWWS